MPSSGDVIAGLARSLSVCIPAAGADGGSVQIMGGARAPRLVQTMVVGEIGAVGLLFGVTM